MTSVTFSQTPVWRSLGLRIALAIVPTWLTIAALSFETPWRIRAIVAAVFLVTLASPLHGLLAAAAIAPLGKLIATLLDYQYFRIGEAVVVAFIAGWLIRTADDRPGPRVPPLVGWLLGLAVALSVAVQAWHLRDFPGETSEMVERLFHVYFLVGDPIGFVDAARIFEGLTLAVAVVSLLRQRPDLARRLPIALAIPATLAAISSLLLWYGVAPHDVLARYSRIGYRVSAHVGDVNAAGSYFAMILCLAAGIALRETGVRRVAWLLAAGASAAGLWLSASRSAAAAAALVVMLGAVWLLTSRWRPRRRAAALALVIVALAVGGALRVRALEKDREFRSAGFREQFNATSLRMIEARPIFGVGVGQYYVTSALFLSPELAFAYGVENAHNYFLQIVAELGGLGGALFAIWVIAGAARAGRALGHAPTDTRLLGAAAGVVALVGTSITGHPLLVDEVAIPFWLQFGLMVGLAGSALLNRACTEDEVKAPALVSWRWSAAAAIVAVVLIVAAPINAMRRPVEPPQSQIVDGFYGWETDEHGTRFRWMGQYGSLFVPANVTQVAIPIRLPYDVQPVTPMGIEIMVRHAYHGRIIVDSKWSELGLALPAVDEPARFKRIDIRADHTWQPAIYVPGSADLRHVSVQIGEPRILHER